MTSSIMSNASEPAINTVVSHQKRILLWDLPLRLFHWLLTIAITIATVTGFIGGNWMALHGKAGLAILGLLSFRLAWGFVGSTYARFNSFFPSPSKISLFLRGKWSAPGHNPLGAISVLALLLAAAAQAGSGLFSNNDIDFTGPLFNLVPEKTAAVLTSFHKLSIYALLALIALHIFAIFWYLKIKKQNLVTPMLTGWKEVDDDVRPVASKPRWLALILSLAFAAATIYFASGAYFPQTKVPEVVQEKPAW
ncbi:cytochrome b/b6 domain-containing protein [Undibacterium pigrum]|uniref:Cytochrome b n=1 Tax=Undibacterium pigrum TaxID=401470 RepID=A0A318JB33_9BURK|nr:cytochrome b/b6 domain-containing protein [Undibacterium pigrum]PXX44057.1 cytochrome b [Undibacterium pigrum]